MGGAPEWLLFNYFELRLRLGSVQGQFSPICVCFTLLCFLNAEINFPKYFLGAKGKLCFIEYLLGVSHYQPWYLLNLSITNSVGITIILNSESSKLRPTRHSAVLLQRHISVTRESLYRIHACLTLLPIPFYIADQIIYAWIFPLESHSERLQNLLLRIQGITADCRRSF